MTGRSAGPARRTLRIAALVLWLAPAFFAVRADERIAPAGGGGFDLELRQFDATDVFLPDQYGTSTLPGSELRYSMLRLTGTQGLGHDLSIEYDLRAAHIEKIHDSHGQRLVQSAAGLQDQEIGLNLGLRQRRTLADSISLNVIIPTGQIHTVPSLGVGHTAIEPDYQIGVAHGGLQVSLEAGPRVFVDGGAAQMRAELDTMLAVSRRLELGILVFYVRTLTLHKPLPLADSAELYNVLRPGLRLKYRVSRHFKPFIEYERDVAGQAIHAGQRLTVGVSYEY